MKAGSVQIYPEAALVAGAFDADHPSAVREAVEGAAKIADEFAADGDWDIDTASAIAAAIRARGEKNGPMRQTHPVEQDIEALVVFESETASQEYKVGQSGVTRIEACAKGGEFCDIPYIRVWAGDEAIAEFCQHAVKGVYFKRSGA